jgi:hypothetical protein
MNNSLAARLRQSNIAKGLVAAGTAILAAPSFAAVTTIDTADATGQVAEGATAAGAIGLAFIAFVILIGVLLKVRRAGS